MRIMCEQNTRYMEKYSSVQAVILSEAKDLVRSLVIVMKNYSFYVYIMSSDLSAEWQ